MNTPVAQSPPPKWRGTPVVAPPPPRLRRPPGPLKLGPCFRKETPPTETMGFRFRTRYICAAATPVDGVRQNVLRLHLQPSIVQRLIQVVAGFLPSRVRGWLDSSFPEWNLPSRVILKKQKEGWEEEFEMEKATYAKLRPLQGIVIPRLLGELRYDNARALLLSDIGGACLATPEGALLEPADLRRMLCQALTALSHFGISQDDIKLDNFQLTGDKIMMVDLERVNEVHLLGKEELDLGVKDTVDILADNYDSNQYCFWEDGLISIDN
ncbi:hypothetical protein VTK56DRAFT_1495 [Thermocarpiscus australiensis]